MEQHHDHHHTQAPEGGSGAMLEIVLKNCSDASDLAGIERFLSAAPGVPHRLCRLAPRGEGRVAEIHGTLARSDREVPRPGDRLVRCRARPRLHYGRRCPSLGQPTPRDTQRPEGDDVREQRPASSELFLEPAQAGAGRARGALGVRSGGRLRREAVTTTWGSKMARAARCGAAPGGSSELFGRRWGRVVGGRSRSRTS